MKQQSQTPHPINLHSLVSIRLPMGLGEKIFFFFQVKYFQVKISHFTFRSGGSNIQCQTIFKTRYTLKGTHHKVIKWDNEQSNSFPNSSLFFLYSLWTVPCKQHQKLNTFTVFQEIKGLSWLLVCDIKKMNCRKLQLIQW